MPCTITPSPARPLDAGHRLWNVEHDVLPKREGIEQNFWHDASFIHGL